MNDDLFVVWNGGLERAGHVPGLSSYLGSSTLTAATQHGYQRKALGGMRTGKPKPVATPPPSSPAVVIAYAPAQRVSDAVRAGIAAALTTTSLPYQAIATRFGVSHSFVSHQARTMRQQAGLPAWQGRKRGGLAKGAGGGKHSQWCRCWTCKSRAKEIGHAYA